MGIPETVMLFLAAISIAIGLNHLFLASRLKWSVLHLAIFLCGLMGFFYMMILFYGYQAEPDIHAISRIYRYHLLLLQASMLALVWAFALLINTIAKKWLWAMLIAFSVLIVGTIFIPENLLFTRDLTVTYTVVFGSQVLLLSNGITFWRLLADFTVMVTIFFLVTFVFRHLMKQGTQIQSKLLVVTVIILIAAIVDHLIDAGGLNFMYVLPVGYFLSFSMLSSSSLEKFVNDLRNNVEIAMEERKWRTMVSDIKLLIVQLNTLGQIKYANPFLLEFTGYTEDELLGKDWFELLLPTNYSYSVQSAFIEILANDFHSHYQNPILTKYKEEKLIYWYNVRLRDHKGKITGSISIGCDITEIQQERDKLEQALKTARETIEKLEKN